MAKSARAKSKIHHRRVKRVDPRSAYYIADQARTLRLAQKLRTAGISSDDNQSDNAPDHDESMDTDAPEKPKVSTSGPRNSRKEQYRKAKGLPAKQYKVNNLAPGARRSFKSKSSKRH